MSTKYPGGIISKTAPTPSGPYSTDTAPGIWTLEQQAYWQKLGQWPTAGNVNPNAFIENLFQTYLYTGNGATQTITNGIDLSTNGGLVWLKGRSLGYNNGLFDTVRGADYLLCSNNTDPSTSVSGIPANPWVTGFNSNGFGLGSNGSANASTQTYASWTFRKQAKFFDMVTYSGSNSTQTISHNLGSTPGCIIIKKLDSNTFNAGWSVYHRSLSNPDNYYLVLNTTAGQTNYGGAYISSVDSSTFTIAGGAGGISIAGSTYIAYIFAHNAGGFGLSGSDNVITCGSFTASAGQTTVTLGYEPQWILIKESSASGDNWKIWDAMRGWSQSTYAELYPNTSAAEAAGSGTYTYPTATGFVSEAGWLTSGSTYIYVAIRRGPMATPTVGTSVYVPVSQSTSGSYPRPVVTNFPVDFVIMGDRNSTWGYNWSVQDRLRGKADVLFTSATTSENTGALSSFAYNTQFGDGWVTGGTTGIYECFRRAPGFMDVVCYTGTGSNTTQSHNLGVVPELMILKPRSNGSNGWCVYSATVGNTGRLLLDTSDAAITGYSVFWNNTTPTSSVFSLGTAALTNESATTFVAYLFATCPGVSKVGSYTGTGTTLQVNCGFTGGARFVMIKRTDSTGDWYVWDSVRGIVAGNDPYLLLNSTAAEVTGTDYVDTYSAGFEISSTAPSAINASGGTFIFLAIA